MGGDPPGHQWYSLWWWPSVSWFAHRGNDFTLIELERLSNLVSLTASQGIRANVFNQSDQPMSAIVKCGMLVATPFQPPVTLS